MKYVAFLDILGFKKRLKQFSQKKAKSFIADFSSIVYSVFNQTNNSNINGFIVSDSVILYTENITIVALNELIEIIISICRREFSENGILIRGAIAKGEFDKMPAEELPKLSKQLIVGQAYVDAYLLEDSIKTIGINLSNDVYQDLSNSNINLNIIEERIDDKTYYVFRYITLDYLLDTHNLNQFINLAKESKWLPHYYNALYFAMKNENNDKKVEQVFINIQNIVCNYKHNENWRDLDLFIRNSFSDDVIEAYKVRFLKHIRKNLFSSKTS